MEPTATDATPYYRLDPDTVLQAVDSTGLLTDGRLLALNSYENRVYQVGIEDRDPIVAKFYRPGRWSDAQIQEEHDFSQELADAEIPLIEPMRIDGQSLFRHEGFRFALFRRQGGHAPELEDKETLLWLGRFIGRIHAVGRARPFRHRPALTPQRFGAESIATIIEGRWLPPHMEAAFESLAEDLMSSIENAWARAGDFRTIRLHGDCHPGNLLWRDAGAHVVDLDDACTGPAVQDLWMLLSGEPEAMAWQLRLLLRGYAPFMDFDRTQLRLIEPLRLLRMIRHNAWVAQRWQDPAFPRAFPDFGSSGYWGQQALQLQEQLRAVAETPTLDTLL